MPIAYKVEVQPKALADMTEAVTYIASELKNPGAAERLVEELVLGMESLASMPTRCPLYSPSRPLKHEYRYLKVRHYLVFFTVSEQKESVTVSRVLHARRSLTTRLERPFGYGLLTALGESRGLRGASERRCST